MLAGKARSLPRYSSLMTTDGRGRYNIFINTKFNGVYMTV